MREKGQGVGEEEYLVWEEEQEMTEKGESGRVGEQNWVV